MDEKNSLVDRVASQYEKYPYPALPPILGWFAKPAIGKDHPLSFSEAKRILVAGCGVFESVVVAKANPKAKIVAIDLSNASLKRAKLHAAMNLCSHRIRFLRADLHDLKRVSEIASASFDLIICTGVLHHSPHPEQVIQTLSSLLVDNGVLRLMTYPERSRIWIYEIQKYFQEK